MDETFASTDNSADLHAVPVAMQYIRRAALRQRCIAERIALAAMVNEHRARSALIEQHLAAWFAQRAPASLSFCAAIRGEFDCEPLVLRLIGQGWRAAMAVATKSDAALVFRHWAPGVAMKIDHHGIPVPRTAVVATPEVLLIPLVAFDNEGYRLGYGGGYFDRTLAQAAGVEPKPIAIGIGFALAQVDSVLPQSHDRRMDMVVTEAGLWSPPTNTMVRPQ